MQAPLVHLAAGDNPSAMWYPNSGATNHITPDYYDIQSVKSLVSKSFINTADGTLMKTLRTGNSVSFSNHKEYRLK